MGDTTNIYDLPTDPTGGGGSNISLQVSETGPSTTQNPVQSLDQNTINSIINGLQQANVSGATQLPSRDIPRTTDGIMQDEQIHPNYVPSAPAGRSDYIHDYEENDQVIQKYNKQLKNSNSLDDMYDEIQTPLLLCVLFFLFQLPIFKSKIFTYAPALCLKDGNYNIYGYIFISILYGLVYYTCTKVISRINNL
jgi:hypothetical protein